MGTTPAPERTNAPAHALPIPRPAPVTTAVFPRSRPQPRSQSHIATTVARAHLGCQDDTSLLPSRAADHPILTMAAHAADEETTTAVRSCLSSGKTMPTPRPKRTKGAAGKPVPKEHGT